MPFAERLRWVQSSAGGVDGLPCDELRRRGIALTRCTLFSPVIAHHAVAMAWAITRALPEAWTQQHRGDWDQALPFLPMPARALVLGLGPIGRAIAVSLRAQGIHVTGVKRTLGSTKEIDCTRLLDSENWRSILPRIDWCFLALPLTEKTRLLFDQAALRALPSHAVLVNVGRGETIDNAALIDALREDRLGGAALDVVDHTLREDPLFWRTPRLLFTPHVAAHTPDRAQSLQRFFERQLSRYLVDEPLEDVVDLNPAATRRDRIAG